MNAPAHTVVHEGNQSLWRLVVSPTIWGAHFLLCYITAAIYCAKFAGPDSSFTIVRAAIGAYTALALLGIGVNGLGGWRRYRLGSERVPFDADTPEDRHRFLGFATVLLAGLSAVATLFSAMVALVFEDCR